jgi:hypothetical protein
VFVRGLLRRHRPRPARRPTGCPAARPRTRDPGARRANPGRDACPAHEGAAKRHVPRRRETEEPAARRVDDAPARLRTRARDRRRCWSSARFHGRHPRVRRARGRGWPPAERGVRCLWFWRHAAVAASWWGRTRTAPAPAAPRPRRPARRVPRPTPGAAPQHGDGCRSLRRPRQTSRCRPRGQDHPGICCAATC